MNENFIIKKSISDTYKDGDYCGSYYELINPLNKLINIKYLNDIKKELFKLYNKPFKSFHIILTYINDDLYFGCEYDDNLCSDNYYTDNIDIIKNVIIYYFQNKKYEMNNSISFINKLHEEIPLSKNYFEITKC